MFARDEAFERDLVRVARWRRNAKLVVWAFMLALFITWLVWPSSAHAQVPGMNCARPAAPTCDTAPGRQPDSWWICAAKVATGASRPHTARAVRVSSAR